ncbi:MAG: hypothetical protein ACI906_000449 [Candidatus Latescibacterota bacterium]|jgi:hypothetical protein
MKYLAILIAAILSGALAGSVQAEKEDTTVEWYGYFKLDMAHDSAVSSNGNYILYVAPHGKGDAVSTLNLTARQSRFGAKIHRGPMRGVLEFDFYGSSPENKNALMLRKAYVTAPLGPFSLEAGQTTDLISPLVPSTINYSAMWGVGNVGYRRPQVKIYQNMGAYYWAVALSRNLSGDLDGDGLDDGEASGLPAVQARVACNLDIGVDLSVGTSVHYGRCDCPDEDKQYDNWSLNGDMKMVINKEWSLLAEAYTGVNMNQYGGAIYNAGLVDGLRSSGGWANVLYRPVELWQFSAGGGLDQVRKEDLGTTALSRSRNAVLFANGQYQVISGLWAGFEVSRWTTRYLNAGPGDVSDPSDLRLQWSLRGDF